MPRRGTIKFDEVKGTYDKLDENGNVLKNEKKIKLPLSSKKNGKKKSKKYHAIKMTVTLPQTVYTSAILGPLLSNRDICESINHNIVLLISHVFQFTLIKLY